MSKILAINTTPNYLQTNLFSSATLKKIQLGSALAIGLGVMLLYVAAYGRLAHLHQFPGGLNVDCMSLSTADHLMVTGYVSALLAAIAGAAATYMKVKQARPSIQVFHNGSIEVTKVQIPTKTYDQQEMEMFDLEPELKNEETDPLKKVLNHYQNNPISIPPSSNNQKKVEKNGDKEAHATDDLDLAVFTAKQRLKEKKEIASSEWENLQITRLNRLLKDNQFTFMRSSNSFDRYDFYSKEDGVVSKKFSDLSADRTHLLSRFPPPENNWTFVRTCLLPNQYHVENVDKTHTSFQISNAEGIPYKNTMRNQEVYDFELTAKHRKWERVTLVSN